MPVRVGRWKIPGRPRTLLVDASGLYAKKDDFFATLWDRYRVDSLFGSWDYAEPVLFGQAAGLVIERWHQEFVAPIQGEAVAQFHEWMTGAGLLQVKQRLPSVGTIFTAHATVLGRSLGALGQGPDTGLAGRTPEQAAEAMGVRSKHSLEVVAAREADVLTTVSEVTAAEVEVFLGRRVRPVLVNGIDVEVQDAMAGATTRLQAHAALRRLAERFLGEDLSDARILATSGRYELHNKGLDVLVDALGRLAREPGPRAVLLALVPAGTSGLRRDVLDRLAAPARATGPLPGLSTHNLFEGDADPIAKACAAAGLHNAPGSRVMVIHVAAYLSDGDGLLGLPYEAALRGVDFALFPSFYEPWGYTPVEALAAGVPTVTSDQAGFGLWAQANGLGPAEGVTVLGRRFHTDAEAAAELAVVVARFLAAAPDVAPGADVCRQSASSLSWSKAISHYETAFRMALVRAGDRALGAARPPRAASAEAAGDGGPHFVPFEVAAALPDPLRGLDRVAKNLWWTWDPEAPALFEALSPEGWVACHHNPVALLADVPAADLSPEAKDPELIARARRVVERFDRYMATAPSIEALPEAELAAATPWAPFRPALPTQTAPSPARPIAYFCAEFGLHESMPIYSGGLGVLAGDHLKAASDLALPLVAVGLFYRKGYLRQRVSVLGDQIPLGVENEPRDLPMELVRDASGHPLDLAIDLPGTRCVLAVWRVMVGRVALYLLDADTPENRPEDRAVTHQLYGGDQELRLRQEIVLGKRRRPPARAPGHRAVGRPPERGPRRPAPARAHQPARARVGPDVRRGRRGRARDHDVHDAHAGAGGARPLRRGVDAPLLQRLRGVARPALGPVHRAVAGRRRQGLQHDLPGAPRSRGMHNGVSRLHGRVSRRLLAPCWPGLLEDEVPVGSVTNGVHLADVDRPRRRARCSARATVRPRAPTSRRGRTASTSTRCGRCGRRPADASCATCATGSSPRATSGTRAGRSSTGCWPASSEGALLVGFARRFATYKRADLLMRDLKRLRGPGREGAPPGARLLRGQGPPAGQGGPGDPQEDRRGDALRAAPRQGLLPRGLRHGPRALARAGRRRVAQHAGPPHGGERDLGDEGRGQRRPQRLDPRRLVGRGLRRHQRVRDRRRVGGRHARDRGRPRRRESSTRSSRTTSSRSSSTATTRASPAAGSSACGTRWPRCRPSSTRAGWSREYRDKGYAPLGAGGLDLTRDGFAAAKARAALHARLRKAFPSVRIASHRIGSLEGLVAGSQVVASADVDLAGLSPQDVVVELVFRGPVGASRVGTGGAAAPVGHSSSRVAAVLEASGPGAGPVQSFFGTATLAEAGRFSGAVRVRPRRDLPGDDALADLVVWA